MAKEKSLSAKEFCEIVLDENRKLPRIINLNGIKAANITKLFGWFETIRSCGHYNHFEIVAPQWCPKIEKMRITETELLSLLILWKMWKEKPDTVYYK